MKKLVFYSNCFKSLSHPYSSRSLFHSTEALSSNSPLKTRQDTLYSRLSPVGGDPSVSIVPILNQWIEQGNTVKKMELVNIIKQLRFYKHFKHALEVSQWMSDQRYMALNPGDVAVRLDLISKVYGIEQAERYFDNIPKQCKLYPVYNTLLNCYAQSRSIEKAEALMQQIRDMKFEVSPLAYNVLLNLYSHMGQYEKLDDLIKEMTEKGVHPDKFTYSIRLSAYVAASDIDGMEKTLDRMEADPKIIMDWNVYAIAANGYIKAGLIEKALHMLKKSESRITEKKRRAAYDFLLTMYVATGRKDHVYRIWECYKRTGKLYNIAYISMIRSLLKLDDILGAEKILEEWECGDTAFDFRVPNLLIADYCRNDLLEKAEKLVIKLIEKGEKPHASTWGILARGYVQANQIPMAVKTMKAAFMAARPGWKPNIPTLTSCLKYLKQQGDVEGAEEFKKLLVSTGLFSVDDCERLEDDLYICREDGDFEPEAGRETENISLARK